MPGVKTIHSKVIITLAVIVAMIGGWEYLAKNPGSRQKSDNKAVLVQITFGPPKRDRISSVYYEVDIGNDNVDDGLLDASPFTRIFLVPKGQTINVVATQEFGGPLNCVILEGENELDSDHNNGQCEVMCSHRHKSG